MISLTDPRFAWLAVAAGGVAAACWRQLRGLLSQAASLLVVRTTFDDGVGRDVGLYVQATMRRAPLGDAYFASATLRDRATGWLVNAAFEVPNRGVTYRAGWRPLHLKWGGGNTDNADVSYIRGTFRRARLANAAAAWFADYQHRQSRAAAEAGGDRFFVRRLNGRREITRDPRGAAKSTDEGRPGSSPSLASRAAWHGLSPLLGRSWDEFGYDRGAPVLDSLALPPEAEHAVAEVRRWLAARDWYSQRQIPWRLGLLFHGSPGNAKTATVKAMAMDLHLPIYILDLAGMDNEDLADAFVQVRGQAPCVALIEDIDGVFHGRDNVVDVGNSHRAKVTFDALLNAVGGVEECDGVLLVVTTNRIEHLDDALGRPLPGDPTRTTRPGRLDVAAEFTAPDAAGRAKIAARILRGYEPEIPGLVEAGVADSGAQFQERCRVRALELFTGRPAAPPPPAAGPRTAEGVAADSPPDATPAWHARIARADAERDRDKGRATCADRALVDVGSGIEVSPAVESAVLYDEAAGGKPVVAWSKARGLFYDARDADGDRPTAGGPDHGQAAAR